MVIDVWMQHPTSRLLALDIFASLRRWTGGAIPEEAPGIDATVAAMDAAGVGFGLLSAWSAPYQEPLISNDEVADWVATYPDRFAGLACVDLDKPMTAVRELRRCVTDLGFMGLRVVPWLWNAPPTDRRYYPLYAECVRLRVPFCTQVGHTGPLALGDRPADPVHRPGRDRLPGADDRVRARRVSVDRGDDRVARKHDNVVIDTSAYTTKRLPTELVAYLKTRSGQRKVLFGTNYPMIMPGHALDGLDELGLSDEARHRYLAGNARRVFGLNPHAVTTAGPGPSHR